MAAYYDYGREKWGFKIAHEVERDGHHVVVDFVSVPAFSSREDAEAAEDEAEGYEFEVHKVVAGSKAAARAAEQRKHEAEAGHAPPPKPEPPPNRC